jgi:hypothetical protein
VPRIQTLRRPLRSRIVVIVAVETALRMSIAELSRGFDGPSLCCFPKPRWSRGAGAEQARKHRGIAAILVARAGSPRIDEDGGDEKSSRY